eukprot:NODE_1069_length_1593_cov_78.674870_g880_i0.p1 GENE.NODE_1069_length_1593_cov_78.674870_g880_i0~~NODE_1069_length_1593_cov_78.674870_g880_i0.p1  ORF type:complete len:381 (-),score=94.63 NODE_1069_length_1593_cov_78.674870_g880_i0:57-1199(-)
MTNHAKTVLDPIQVTTNAEYMGGVGADPDRRYGAPLGVGESAAEVIQASGMTNHAKTVLDSVRENTYATHRREPLGRTPVQGNAPAQAHQMVHGKASQFDANAKEVIFPTDIPPPTSAPASLGGTAEGSLRKAVRHEPGQQRNRGYKWDDANVDIQSHRFGSVPKPREESAASCLRSLDVHLPDEKLNRVDRTEIVPKGLAQRRLLQGDSIGQARLRGTCPSDVLSNSVPRGVKTTKDAGGAAACLRGLETDNVVDQSIGKSTRFGFRNDVDTGERSFGVPSIRTDLQKPVNQKVTDFNNYGDGQTAASTVCPSKYAQIGVFEEDFSKPIAKEQMKALSDRTGLLDPEDVDGFNEAWEQARQLSTDGFSVSVHAFLKVLE